MGMGALEHPAFRRKPVQVGSLGQRVAGEPRRVGSKRVDGDQDDVPGETGVGRLRPGRRYPSAGPVVGLRRRPAGAQPNRRARQNDGAEVSETAQSDSRYSENCFASSARSPSGSNSRRRRKSAAAAALLPRAMLAKPRK